MLIQQEIANKERARQDKQDRILHLNDAIKARTEHFKTKQAKAKAVRVAVARNHTHHGILDIDREKRPSDRDYEIRMYSKMDLDVWKYHEVRDWFNKDANPPPPYQFRPQETGYTIGI